MAIDWTTKDDLLEGIIKVFEATPVHKIRQIDFYSVMDAYRIMLPGFEIELAKHHCDSNAHLSVKKANTSFSMFSSSDKRLKTLYETIEQKVRQYEADGRPQHNKDDPTRFREALAEALKTA